MNALNFTLLNQKSKLFPDTCALLLPFLHLLQYIWPMVTEE